HVSEVSTVGTVLQHHLGVDRLAVGLAGELRVGPVEGAVGSQVREEVENAGHLPRGWPAVGLVPHEYAVVLFVHGIHPQPQPPIDPGLPRDVLVAPVRAPAPSVERALHAIADHCAAMTEVGAEVAAM